MNLPTNFSGVLPAVTTRSPLVISSTNQSALTIGNVAANPTPPGGTLDGGGPATGSIMTDLNNVIVPGEVGLGISFTHWNNILDGNFATLTGATITDTLVLTPTVTGGGARRTLRP